MLQRLSNRLRREAFLTTPLSIIVNPLYIIRYGLFKSIAQLAPKISGRVLDFGCGSKPYESLFVNASTYLGVDLRQSGHDHKDSKVDVYYDGKTLPFPDDHFDAVVCFEVMDDIFNLDMILEELRRVLRPGGLVLASMPFAWDEHEVPFDFARYTSFGARHVIEKNGFEVIELKKTTTYVLAVCQMFIAYVYQHVLPRRKLLKRLVQLVVVVPLTLVSLVLNALLPKRYEYFCNVVILSKKVRS